jgi:Recombination endonuclease VII
MFKRGTRRGRICTDCFLPTSYQVCRYCKVNKQLREFHKSGNRVRGRASDCKECRAKRSKEIWANPKERKVARERTVNWLKSQSGKYKVFERNLIREYGIDLEDWARMMNAQNRKCACCEGALQLDRTTHVDHCHNSGDVRALLCQWCNSVLGYAKDDVSLLQKAVNYLKRHNAKSNP